MLYECGMIFRIHGTWHVGVAVLERMHCSKRFTMKIQDENSGMKRFR
jgi:hypothetical protein